MAVSNIHETLLMYTKQKSLINMQLSDVMMDMLSATRKNAELQQQYNKKVQDAYFDGDVGYAEDSEAYIELMDLLENEHMFDLKNLESWESELELKKNSLETKLNEITAYEQSWTKLLQNNIKQDFSYGGGK